MYNNRGRAKSTSQQLSYDFINKRSKNIKKIISAVALATSISTANAMAVPSYIGTPHIAPTTPYNVGYRHGKNDAFHTVATVAVVTGFLVAAGIVIYNASYSRWGVNDKGVVYRF